MMFTSEFNETLDMHDRFDTDDLLFSHDATPASMANAEKDLITITEEIITTVENNFNPEEDNHYFTMENESFIDMSTVITHDENATIQLIQTEHLLNDEPTLLDENTVNQFLLPLPASTNENKENLNTGPDLLALYSCVICHDIFTNDADLLDHTILMHASDNSTNSSIPKLAPQNTNSGKELPTGSTNFDAEWLVCCLCERVLSTALENEPTEQLCCIDINGKSSVAPRKLSTMFVCDICNYLFADGEALDCHKLSCYSESDQLPGNLEECILEAPLPQSINILPCTLCGKQCSTDEELRAHAESHRPGRGRRAYTPGNSSKMWNCGSCNQLFATARELYRHKRGEDRPPGAPVMAYVCEECDKELGSMCALHTHKKMHKVSKPGYPCRVCGRRFNQSGHLAIHMRMHTGERPYPCDLCSKAFKVKVERDDHRRTHTGERPFACTACPKTFTAAARLREHARIHTDQRPYRCDICGAAFRRPYARTVHTLIHTGQKPHECNVCGTAFRRSGDMWKHKRTLHGIQPEVEAKK
ncbi:unnamed protein product [Colias eurytheme]|nr:unnamed protein product [Colias eurytheme]